MNKKKRKTSKNEVVLTKNRMKYIKKCKEGLTNCQKSDTIPNGNKNNNEEKVEESCNDCVQRFK